MNPFQKIAWYNLAVIALAVAACLVLYTLTGHPQASMAGFGLLGLLGFSALFLGRQKGTVLYDERDREIERKAFMTGFFVFWLSFVAACMLIPFSYNHQPVPSYLFFGLCMGGLMVFLGARSVAVLVLYRRDSQESGALLDSFREMADLQKSAWMGLIILLFILIPFLFFFPVEDQNLVSNLVGMTFMLVMGAVFFNMRKAWKAVEMDENEEEIVQKAGKAGLWGFGITFVFGGLVLASLYAIGSAVLFNMISFAGFCAFAVGLLSQPVSILVQYTGRGKKGRG